LVSSAQLTQLQQKSSWGGYFQMQSAQATLKYYMSSRTTAKIFLAAQQYNQPQQAEENKRTDQQPTSSFNAESTKPL
jgi:hypothetical protein